MPTAMLSQNFSYAELIFSQTASRMGLSNEPDTASYNNLKRLCNDVLEKVRTICGDVPVTITSGYRSPRGQRRLRRLIDLGAHERNSRPTSSSLAAAIR